MPHHHKGFILWHSKLDIKDKGDSWENIWYMKNIWTAIIVMVR